MSAGAGTDFPPTAYRTSFLVSQSGTEASWASPFTSRLATTSGRIEFVILPTSGLSPVAPHPALRRRSYLRLSRSGPTPSEDFHLTDSLRSQAHWCLSRCDKQARVQRAERTHCHVRSACLCCAALRGANPRSARISTIEDANPDQNIYGFIYNSAEELNDLTPRKNLVLRPFSNVFKTPSEFEEIVKIGEPS